MKPKNGVYKETHELDNQGSTVTIEEKYHSNGVLSKPVRRYFAFNYTVRDKKEEVMAYIKFSEDWHSDPSKVDPHWGYIFSKDGKEKGYYICVGSYTVLDYK